MILNYQVRERGKYPNVDRTGGFRKGLVEEETHFMSDKNGK